MNLAEMFAAEAEAAYRRLRAHQAGHGCEGWSWNEGAPVGQRYSHDKACPVEMMLLHIYGEWSDAAVLPSPDARVYRDWPTTTNEGGTDVRG